MSTWQQTPYTALVIDVYSRRITDLRCAASPSELPLDALDVALWTGMRAGEDMTGHVHHSDASSPNTRRFGTPRGWPTREALPSICGIGDSYDNALAETTIGPYEAECDHSGALWKMVIELELATRVGSTGGIRSDCISRQYGRVGLWWSAPRA